MGVGKARIAAVSVVALLGTALGAGPAAAGHSSLQPVVTGLDGPRGVAVSADGAKVVYSVTDGSVYEASANGLNKHIRKLGQVPGGFPPAIDTNVWGVTYALTGGGGPEGDAPPGGATLFKLRPGKSAQVVADIAAYQAHDPDPYDQENLPTESNPFGVAALRDGTVLVSDAAGNDLLRVWPNGHIKTVARIKPRLVEVPAGLPATDPEGNPLPPAGTPILAEGVATSVTVGSDGYYYLGELRGFPATPGTSEIWRIKPGQPTRSATRSTRTRATASATRTATRRSSTWAQVRATRSTSSSWRGRAGCSSSSTERPRARCSCSTAAGTSGAASGMSWPRVSSTCPAVSG